MPSRPGTTRRIRRHLTALLGLLIGFGFSMASSRYDQRKVYEEAEANAIGTEYVRADLLPAADGAKVRDLLKKYTDQRILFYTVHGSEVAKIDAETTRRDASATWLRPSRAPHRCARSCSAPPSTGCGPAPHRPPSRFSATRSMNGGCARVSRRRFGNWRGTRRGGAIATPWSTWRIRSDRRAGREPTRRR